MHRTAAATARFIFSLFGLAALAACGGNPLGLKPGATSVLDVMAEPTPAEAVDMALDKYDADRRYKGLLLLSKRDFASEEVYVKLFLERTADEDPGVRAVAIRGLGLHGRPEHVPAVVAKLTDEDPGVRLEAARSLQRLHNPAVAPDALLVAISPEKESEPEVRVEAARALGQYAQPRVVERLIASLADSSLAMNVASQTSLRTLTGQDFGFDRAAWQAWYNGSSDYFAGRSAFLYPTFNRSKRWFEYLPFVPAPPNEPATLPAGMSPDLGETQAQ